MWSATSWRSRKRPWVTDRSRTVAHDGVVPTTVDVQLAEPATSVADDCTIGATAAMSGATTFDDRAVASASVNVDAVPSASRIPAVDVVLPGVTVSRLVPRALISELTWFCAP